MNKIAILFILFSSIMLHTSSVIAKNDLDRAIQLFEEANYKDAKSILEQIIDDNDQNAKAYYYLGRTYIALQDYEEAADNLEEAVEIESNIADYHFWLGQAYSYDIVKSSIFSQAILAPKILDEFERTVELDSNHVFGHVGLANFYLQAPSIAGGDLDKALEQGFILLKLDEQRGRVILANTYLEKEQTNLADEQMRLIEEKFGNDKANASFYNTFGYYLLEQNRFEEAIEKFLKQIELIPNQANPYDSLGDAYRAAGRLVEAKTQYEKALSIDPNFEASIDNLEEINEELEDLNN